MPSRTHPATFPIVLILPVDPEVAAKLHVAKQQRVIDDANRATSVAPPGTSPSTAS